MEYASKGTEGRATAALTTGVIGTALGAMNSGLFSGLGRNVWGGNAGYYNGADAVTMQNNPYVTKDMLELQMKLVDSQKENAILNADLSSEKKMVEVYNASLNRTNAVRDELSQRIREVECKVDANAASQSVINCQCNSNLSLLNSQVGQLFALTKMVIPNQNVCPGWGDVRVAPIPVNTGTTTA